jgi:hypothetical protein
MTTARFYATDYDHANPDGWLNVGGGAPTNIIGAGDDSCIEKVILAGNVIKRLRVYFTIALPPTAIVSAERMNAKGTWTSNNPSEAGFELNYTDTLGNHIDNYVPVGKGTVVCAGSQWNSGNILKIWTDPPGGLGKISIADLNAGNFLAYAYAHSTGLGNNLDALVDSVYIEVDYTLPVTGGEKAVIGGGFYFVLP